MDKNKKVIINKVSPVTENKFEKQSSKSPYDNRKNGQETINKIKKYLVNKN